MIYVYNNSPLYTLLYKGGSLEIKPKKYYIAEDHEKELFKRAKEIGQVKFYTKIEDIPQDQSTAESTTIIDKSPVQAGLTEEELKAELAAKEKNKKPDTGLGGTVTNLGEPVTEVLVTQGSLPEPEVKADAEPKVKKEPKPPRKARAEAIGEDSTSPATTS